MCLLPNAKVMLASYVSEKLPVFKKQVYPSRPVEDHFPKTAFRRWQHLNDRRQPCQYFRNTNVSPA